MALTSVEICIAIDGVYHANRFRETLNIELLNVPRIGETIRINKEVFNKIAVVCESSILSMFKETNNFFNAKVIDVVYVLDENPDNIITTVCDYNTYIKLIVEFERA